MTLIARFARDVAGIDSRAATPNLSVSERETLRVMRDFAAYSLGAALLADEGRDLDSVDACERRASTYLNEK